LTPLAEKLYKIVFEFRIRAKRDTMVDNPAPTEMTSR